MLNSTFEYVDGQLCCEGQSLKSIVEKAGTATYVYSAKYFRDRFNELTSAFADIDPLICYSIKSCGNIHIVKLLAEMGCGMDVVSGGEVYRAQQAGVEAGKIVYAGVGKTDEEIRQAIDFGIGWFNIESEAEFENIARIATEMGKTARAALRVNPDVDPRTHKKTTTGTKESKFGVDIERAIRFFNNYSKHEFLKLDAIHIHIGSPVYTVQPYVDSITKALGLIEELRELGHEINTLDIGGGFAMDYESGTAPAYAEYAEQIVPLLKPFVEAGGKVILEPGRSMAANAGILLTRVSYIKMGGTKKFVIIDSGMHHLIRPTLYESFHFIWPVSVEADHVPVEVKKEMSLEALEKVDVVGPICESGDFLAQNRMMPAVERGDLLAVFSAGAYGMVMASHYNTMPKPAEVLIDGDQCILISKRESYEDLLKQEMETQAL